VTTPYILRERHEGRIVPRVDCGLFFGRRLARKGAKERGFPPELIKEVKRHAQENA
jgi:hypothetical protein